MKNNNKRPVFFDLTRIHHPVMAVMSIAHRISGVILFLAIPVSAYLLDLSLRSPQGYADVVKLIEYSVVKLFLILLLWAFSHHLFAGIRYLLIDIDVGVELHTARRTATAVICAGVVVLLLGLLLLL